MCIATAMPLLSTGITADTGLPRVGGAYALLLHCHGPLTVRYGRKDGVTLPRGTYVYCGSAYGPGGIRARVARHLRAEKTVRWHVDQITTRAGVRDVLAVPGGRECDLVARFAAQAGSHFPLPGFGSSDCRNCVSHLIAVADDFRFD